MVLNVARRVLHDLHDAEDVFQATFLILAKSRLAASFCERGHNPAEISTALAEARG